MKKFTDKLSAKLGMDAGYFFGNSVVMTIQYLSLTLIGIGMGMVFSRFVSKEVYGMYQLVLSFIATIGFFSLPGFNKGIWSDAANNKDGSLNVAIRSKMQWGLIGSLVLLLIGFKYYISDHDSIFALCMIAAAVTFPLFSGGNIWPYFLESKTQYKLSAKLAVTFAIVSKVTIIAAIFIFKESLLFLVIASLGSVAMTNYIGMKVAQTRAKNTDVSRDFKKYGFFLTKIGIIRDVLTKIDSLLIGVFIGPVQLAVYSFALVIPDQITGLIGSVGNIIVPKIAKQDQKDVVKKIIEKAYVITILSTIFIVITVVLIPYVITFIFTGKYADSIIYAQIMTAGLIPYVFEVILSRILLIKKHKKQISMVNIINPVFRSIVVIIGFVSYGMLGVAISTIAVRVFNLCMYIFFTVQSSRNKI